MAEFRLWIGVKIADGTLKPDPKAPKEFVKIVGVYSFVRVSSGDDEKLEVIETGKTGDNSEREVWDYRPSWFV